MHANEDVAGGGYFGIDDQSGTFVRPGDQIGSLGSGKVANFSIFDCEDYRELAYWFGFRKRTRFTSKGESPPNPRKNLEKWKKNS